MTARYPFTALVGQDTMKLALVLNAINPRLGGVLIRGQKGTAKSTAARGLAALLPPVEVVVGCRFGCQPDPGAVRCPECESLPAPLPARQRAAEFVELPIGATEDRVLGTLDLERALVDGRRHFEPGLLARANRGLLYVDEVNLLPDHLVDTLLDAAAMGTNSVEREGISFSHPAAFVLVGTMNPEEGELRPQLLDRFALAVDAEGKLSPAERVEVVRRRIAYEADPAGFAERWAAGEAAEQTRIRAARALLPHVCVDEHWLDLIARICVAFDVDGLRADIVIYKAASTLAAYAGRDRVVSDDVRRAAELALPHRRRRQPFDQPGLDRDRLADLVGQHNDGATEDPPPDSRPNDRSTEDPRPHPPSAPPGSDSATPGEPSSNSDLASRTAAPDPPRPPGAPGSPGAARHAGAPGSGAGAARPAGAAGSPGGPGPAGAPGAGADPAAESGSDHPWRGAHDAAQRYGSTSATSLASEAAWRTGAADAGGERAGAPDQLFEIAAAPLLPPLASPARASRSHRAAAAGAVRASVQRGLESPRGRHVGSTPRRLGAADIPATLRAAAPHQRARRAAATDQPQARTAEPVDGAQRGAAATTDRGWTTPDLRQSCAIATGDLPLPAAAPPASPLTSSRPAAPVDLPPHRPAAGLGQLAAQASADLEPRRVHLLRSDLRYKVRLTPVGALTLLVVDASGSMAAQRRMAQTKGAVLSLLLRAYQTRDEVALIAFRGTAAEVLLQPTSSVHLASVRLGALPTGGRTPLALALSRAAAVLHQRATARHGAVRPSLVLVSDGRANVALSDGDPYADALAQARRLRATGVSAIVVDTEEGPLHLGRARALAAELGAEYLKLADLSPYQR